MRSLQAVALLPPSLLLNIQYQLIQSVKNQYLMYQKIISAAK